jgi:hypothetical protein
MHSQQDESLGNYLDGWGSRVEVVFLDHRVVVLHNVRRDDVVVAVLLSGLVVNGARSYNYRDIISVRSVDETKREKAKRNRRSTSKQRIRKHFGEDVEQIRSTCRSSAALPLRANKNGGGSSKIVSQCRTANTQNSRITWVASN